MAKPRGNADNLRIHAEGSPEFARRLAKDNVEIMKRVIALETTFRDYGVGALASELGVHTSTIHRARHVYRELPELVPEILDGTLTLGRAYEIAVHGDRVPCPVCQTRGYVFKKRK